MTRKEERITELLAALGIERRGWTVVDHWEADMCAIGLARPSDLRRLVYISTFNKADGRYDYECELPFGPKDTDYESADRREDVTYEELVKALERHLR